ncbi:RNA polymerase sigma factor [Clostridium intestinale]|uniref:RNA polymerase sigma factor n=1 Tax=Clostridium intestinale TaxID=36845 RepID=UPI002DD6A545|nr:sigma-70 family RNA polymerase sigma factor [Clostridium intestinale]WRY50567.1 sigma-70 family RNA polymerase sigma factor [Clostridium intestinale]
MRILVNECYSLLNKKKRVDLQDDMGVYDITYEDNHKGDMIDYINKLDKDARVILTLFYYEDMSIKSISEVLEISNGTVKSRLSRSKEKLKKLLENSEWGGYNE